MFETDSLKFKSWLSRISRVRARPLQMALALRVAVTVAEKLVIFWSEFNAKAAWRWR